ncbi:ankyrin repeat domain-containing protein [Sphingomonas sp. MJ1 (PH-R8)]|uniref:ankyrin repeat domain-containing protein n=1 Tax=Sphingomonas sp. MJ1 (PH-R8) TaxID=3112950 RepID=UPI003A867E9E
MFVVLTAALLAAATPQQMPAVSAAPATAVPSAERRQELLFDAARLGRVDMIDTLVKAGADVDGYDRRGFTPLILAAYNGQKEAVEALLERGADPCKPDAGQGNTAQMGVAFKGDDAIAARLLKTDCDVNARNKAGQTALMMAALFSRTAQVDLLVAAGADASIADATGRTAASVAAAQGNTALAAALSAK